MDAERLEKLMAYIISQGWTPAVEHVEIDRADGDYWYMWKLPLFGETDMAKILAGLDACRQAFPRQLVRLIGYDNLKQTLGTCVVAHRL